MTVEIIKDTVVIFIVVVVVVVVVTIPYPRTSVPRPSSWNQWVH